MSSVASPSAMKTEEDEDWDLVSTPIKNPALSGGALPEAPGAPERPPSVLAKRQKTESPVLDLTERLEAAAPEAPSVEVRLQKTGKVATGEVHTFKALITATPPAAVAPGEGAAVKYEDVVFCVDASDSAAYNGCMIKAKEVLTNFVTTPAPAGVVRRVRMIGFGTHIEDYFRGTRQLTEINEEMRPILLQTIAKMKAFHDGTDIGTPVLFAISVLKESRKEDAARGIVSPEVAHVITLTDGACHSCKYKDAEVLVRAVHESGAPDLGIQTHYVGFSNYVKGGYLREASDDGKLGSCYVAASDTDLEIAFAAVFGFLGCTHTFTFEATIYTGDGAQVKEVHTLGALNSKRTHLLPVTVAEHSEGEAPVLRVQMLANSQPVGAPVTASLVFEHDPPPLVEDDEVLAAMKKLEINQKVQAAIAQSGDDNREASHAISCLSQDDSLSADMRDEIEEIAGIVYRSASAPSSFGAQLASQQTHGLTATPPVLSRCPGVAAAVASPMTPLPPVGEREMDEVDEVDEVDDNDLPLYRTAQPHLPSLRRQMTSLPERVEEDDETCNRGYRSIGAFVPTRA